MVLMNAGKNARHAASITAIPNCGGTAKKSGTVPRVGYFLGSNVGFRGATQSNPKTCVVSTTVQTQRTGYRATIGGRMG